MILWQILLVIIGVTLAVELIGGTVMWYKRKKEVK